MAISQLYPNQRPTLNLNFVRSKTLDPRITFTRNSTATYVGSNGLIQTAAANEARFDHNSNGDSLGLLIEEARTNSYPDSTLYTNWTHYQGNVTSVSASGIAPDGTNTATLLYPNTDGVRAHFYKSTTIASLGTATISIYMKSAGRQWIILWDPWSQYSVSFDILNGVKGTVDSNIGDANARIEPAGNGWYKCSVTRTKPTGNHYLAIDIVDNDDGVLNASLDGTSGVLLWGTQLEQGSFPTSYIPTTGSQSQRLADLCEITGNNFSEWYNQNEWTVTNSFNVFGSSVGQLHATSFFGVGGETVLTSSVLNNTMQHFFLGGPGGTSIIDYVNLPPSTFNTDSKSALTFVQQSTAQGATNGVLATNLLNTPSTNQTINQLSFGQRAKGTTATNGHIKRFSFYPYRLTDSQLQELTR